MVCYAQKHRLKAFLKGFLKNQLFQIYIIFKSNNLKYNERLKNRRLGIFIQKQSRVETVSSRQKALLGIKIDKTIIVIKISGKGH